MIKLQCRSFSSRFSWEIVCLCETVVYVERRMGVDGWWFTTAPAVLTKLSTLLESIRLWLLPPPTHCLSLSNAHPGDSERRSNPSHPVWERAERSTQTNPITSSWESLILWTSLYPVKTSQLFFLHMEHPEGLFAAYIPLNSNLMFLRYCTATFTASTSEFMYSTQLHAA